MVREERHPAGLFPFGYGLGYGRFALEGLSAQVAGQSLQVSFRVRNVGKVAGKEVAQVYVSPEAGGWRRRPGRLGAFHKVSLNPGEVSAELVSVDPRLLATWSEERHGWLVVAGRYKVTLATSAADPGRSTTVTLPERFLPPDWGSPRLSSAAP